MYDNEWVLDDDLFWIDERTDEDGIPLLHPVPVPDVPAVSPA